MSQAFKVKCALLSQLKDMMLLDSVEQVKTWLRMRDDDDAQLSEDDTQVILPANPRPRGKAQIVSERILSKRNGVCKSHFCRMCCMHAVPSACHECLQAISSWAHLMRRAMVQVAEHQAS